MGIPVVEYDLRHLFNGGFNFIGGYGNGIIAGVVICMRSNGFASKESFWMVVFGFPSPQLIVSLAGLVEEDSFAISRTADLPDRF